MRKRVATAAGLFVVLCCAAAAAPPLSPAQKAAICGKRSTCTISTFHQAGKDAGGTALVVAEADFGIKDRPEDAPDAGCDALSGEKGNGGTEYWLVSASPPKKLLALCNDGYGAADVGEDHITFANNRLIHEQDGGSNWRWDVTTVIRLAPFATLKETSCSYFDGSGNQATVLETDLAKFRAVTVEKDPRAQWGDGDAGCPTVKESMFDSPQPRPAPKLLAGYNIVTPDPQAAAGSGKVLLDDVPAGTTLGSCAMTLATDGGGGFVVFGKPASGATAAEMKVVALASQTLVVQVFDPAPGASAGKSWIGGSHVEVWLPKDADAPPTRGNLDQLAFDLDGTVHEGIGNPAAPHVEHWKARDEHGRPVSVLLLRWKDSDTLPLGTAIVYSQSENGRQTRLVASTGMEHGLPLFLPQIADIATRCVVHAERLDTE
jgi:hypothetical protein